MGQAVLSWRPVCVCVCVCCLLLLPSGCAGNQTQAAAGTDGRWEATVLWEGREKIQSVAIGDIDPDRPGLEAVAVDAAGDTVLMTFDRGRPSASVIYRHGARLTGLLVADIDPRVAGSEIYVGGAGPGGGGGAVVQLAVTAGRTRARTVFAGDGFVHALARLAPPAGGTASLVVPTYAGRVHLATPGTAAGPWKVRLLHTEPAGDDLERRKIKDVVAGRIGGLPRRIFIGVRSGRGVLLDPARPGAATLLHTEKGGIARIALGPGGDLFLAGNEGRVVRLSREEAGWRATPLFRERGPLRGIVAGSFAVGRARAPVAVYGYPGFCRALLPRSGGWASFTLFKDTDKGHWLAAADLVPGNGSDELLLGGYSRRVVLLVRKRGS